MKITADKRGIGINYKVGDLVLVKLQDYNLTNCGRSKLGFIINWAEILWFISNNQEGRSMMLQ